MQSLLIWVQMFREGHKLCLNKRFFSNCVAFTQYLNFTSDKVTFSFRRIERRWTVQPTWPPCTMDYDHVKSLAKYYKTFFFAELYTKITNSFNKREHNFVIFVIFHSCLFKIRSVYIRTIYADEKNVLLCILAF